MRRTVPLFVVLFGALAACSGGGSGVESLQLSAARKADRFGVTINPSSLSPAEAGRILGYNTSDRSDAQIRSFFRGFGR
ncbi:MAG: hypothetical protein AAFR35_16035 [Pseudomonadota bacterium]